MILVLAAAACAPAGGEPSSSPGSTTLTGDFISDWPVAIRYPAGWQVAHYQVANSFYQSEAFLSTESMPDPCVRRANSTSCQSWPPVHLGQNGIIVGLWADSFPGWSFDPSAGQPVAVGGQAATFVIHEPDEACRAAGGDEQIAVTIPRAEQWNWWELDACLSGPDLAAGERIVRDMLSLPPGP